MSELFVIYRQQEMLRQWVRTSLLEDHWWSLALRSMDPGVDNNDEVSMRWIAVGLA